MVVRPTLQQNEVAFSDGFLQERASIGAAGEISDRAFVQAFPDGRFGGSRRIVSDEEGNVSDLRRRPPQVIGPLSTLLTRIRKIAWEASPNRRHETDDGIRDPDAAVALDEMKSIHAGSGRDEAEGYSMAREVDGLGVTASLVGAFQRGEIRAQIEAATTRG